MPGALLSSKPSPFFLNHCPPSPEPLHPSPPTAGWPQTARGPALTQHGDGETLAFLLRAWRQPLVQGGPRALGGPQDVSPALFLASLRTVRSMWLLRHHRRGVRHTVLKHTQIRHSELSFRAWLSEREKARMLTIQWVEPGSPSPAAWLTHPSWSPCFNAINGSLSMERCWGPGTNVASPITRPHPPSSRTEMGIEAKKLN